ncbi:hypothetical protein JAB5_33200 [Janthinobacterium sp. HH103]|uniref:hypothetical protein n=1 Tax=Janthinobacterium TaxID=29580 RepID=UPI000873938A|nr:MULTISPECIES: hypothetical protein [Janthinobacterium]MCA1862928.1 hypothetical protein [Janthinobacterium lividum]OEZ64476.1 hypothetical protein JAB2_42140 [Janthinobacterium sp. HH100]OEZ73773.1 hypothetical protein JAB5_33200 [Janthinobacterium sp. HH103]QOU72204.1 hypothetical protein JAB4_016280 [Janthinobacterium sp. HH102]
METTLHATSHADNSLAPGAARPTLQKCLVPVAPTCFLLQACTGADIEALSAYIREIVKTYHAYGSANLTFIISDLHALQHGGFFLPDSQRTLVGGLPIELRYLFASESGVVQCTSSSRTLTYWAKYLAKEGAR